MADIRYTQTFMAIDSYEGMEFPNHRRWAVTYEPLWQAIRAECYFKTLVEAKEAVTRLDAYVGAASDEDERARRLFRYKTILTAIPLGTTGQMGFQRIEYEAQDLIQAVRDRVEDQYSRSPLMTLWDWHTARLQAIAMWETDPRALWRLRAPLIRRARRGTKTELSYFLSILEIVGDGFQRFTDARKQQHKTNNY